jgi:serine/threonine protein kinase/formylglycine-generating enzyme required for sulfatase activity/dienelactone hydrolase
MIGKTVLHYRVLSRLGEGGMGVVYEAEDLRLPRHVALKFLPPERFDDRAARERFEREARAASALSHPHICSVHDVAEQDGQSFIVMELLHGTTLRDRIRAGPIPVEEQLRIGRQVADALDAAHAAGIVHRDVKPANVFVTDRGDAKVLDFGLARLPAAVGADSPSEGPTLERLTMPGSTVGTAAYMSPEQVRGRAVDARSDVFALGVVLYEMATGRLPFSGESLGSVFDAILHEAPASPMQVDASLPPELGRIVVRCLQKDPTSRFRTAAELRDALDRCLLSSSHRSGVARAVDRAARSRWAWPTAALVLVASALGVFAYVRHRSEVSWAREQALPEIRRLASSGFDGWLPAFELAERARHSLPDDPELRSLLDSVSAEMEITSEPAGASVWVKPYTRPQSPWQLLGATPIHRCRLPAEYLRWRIEKPGCAQLSRVEWGALWDPVRGQMGSGERRWRLDPEGSVPPGMVRVDGADGLPDFFVDRYEVTNRRYKEFVAAGGYRQARYWKQPFEHDGRTLELAEAMRLLVDRTGQPGPAGWETSDYAEGQGELPVTGVSWYEAAAYAEFSGKALPTVRHWQLATGDALYRMRDLFGRLLLPISRFGGNGPVAVGSSEAMSAYGAYDLAGNVREWCENASEQGHCLRGGAWNDQTYMYGYVTQAPAFDRSAKNGFRCVKYPDPRSVAASAFDPYQVTTTRDLTREKPVSDEVFAAYREQFSYDPRDLAARVESRDDSHPDWIHETISLTAAYGSERFRVHLFLPRTARPPYQAIVYFPGSSARQRSSSDRMTERIEFAENLAFIPKSGRALVHPVYQGTYERSQSRESGPAGPRELVTLDVQMVQDARRSLDYLQSRPDVDARRIGYYGFSWGGRMASLILAVEPRFRCAVVHSGGFPSSSRPPPEVDPLNYATRVRVPTLMLNGRYDLAVSLQSEARPMFDMLGTPAADKRLYLVDTDHWIPRPDLIRESLAWFDRYLGPVSAPRP